MLKQNLEALQEYCTVYQIYKSSDVTDSGYGDQLDGLYILDEGSCFVKSNYNASENKD